MPKCIKLAFVISLLLCGLACEARQVAEQADSTDIYELPESRYGQLFGMEERRGNVYRFVTERLAGEHGIWTNYTDTDQSQSVATGHETLSESAGLLLRYYALSGQEQSFQLEWERTKRVFDVSSGFSYRYSPLLDMRYPVNAAVDDLRIIRSLFEAGVVFQDERYAREANDYGSRLYRYNVKDGRLYDFYDETYGITNSFITLCYIDLRTLDWISQGVPGGVELYGNMKRLLQQGFLGEHFPFYETRFQYEEQAYQSEGIHTVESLLSILSLAEQQLHESASIEFIKKQVEQGALYGQYTREGKPLTDVQSTAIYAIAAMIGAEIGDRDLYASSVARMNELQVLTENSKLFGAFADEASTQAFSFDNLMAMLAYLY